MKWLWNSDKGRLYNLQNLFSAETACRVNFWPTFRFLQLDCNYSGCWGSITMEIDTIFDWVSPEQQYQAANSIRVVPDVHMSGMGWWMHQYAHWGHLKPGTSSVYNENLSLRGAWPRRMLYVQWLSVSWLFERCSACSCKSVLKWKKSSKVGEQAYHHWGIYPREKLNCRNK